MTSIGMVLKSIYSFMYYDRSPITSPEDKTLHTGYGNVKQDVRDHRKRSVIESPHLEMKTTGSQMTGIFCRSKSRS